jgi:hypothetical protein
MALYLQYGIVPKTEVEAGPGLAEIKGIDISCN